MPTNKRIKKIKNAKTRKINSYGKSHVGRERTNNEDSWAFAKVNTTTKILVVADGMGGHNFGEVASKTAVHVFMDYLVKLFYAKKNLSSLVVIKHLKEAIHQANEAILEKQKEDKAYEGMGTTFTCVVLMGQDCLIANVGDSRAYVLSKDTYKLEQKTVDHSMYGNILTRCLGSQGETTKPDFFTTGLLPGDKIMLCSDGLYNMIPDNEIRAIMLEERLAPLIVKELIHVANRKGGKDNITVVLTTV